MEDSLVTSQHRAIGPCTESEEARHTLKLQSPDLTAHS
jgi:hypothetical protein